MNHQFLAKTALSLLCTLQGAATLAIDFNRTHAKNPLWPGHARFHVVWQSASVGLLSVLGVGLLWGPTAHPRENFYLVLMLTALSPLGFILAWMTRKIFHGTLSDPNGIPPVRTTILGAQLSIDLNFAAVVAALLSLAAIFATYG